MTKGLIFNIQKFCVHDGPGIRTTVFLKGCPLDCWWCHNVESISFGKEPMVRADLCGACGACVTACSEGAVALADGRAVTDLARCVRCGDCVVDCPQSGRAICGREMSVAEVVAEIAKDKVFYEQSGGGATFSGGEAMAQIDFLHEALRGCREQGIHTAVDTSGQVRWESFARILPDTGLFLYDLKIMDEERHRRFTGVSNRLILENLARLAQETEQIRIRFPVIPTVTDDEENIARMIAFLHGIRFQQIDLLPFHPLGKGKAAQLGRDNRMEGIAAPSDDRMEQVRQQFAEAGFAVQVGG